MDEKYEEIELIGSGSFGRVRKVRRKSDGMILACKELYYGNMQQTEKHLLVQEVAILSRLRHPHIVQYHDRIVDRQNQILYIIMEFCECGDLSSLIKKCRMRGAYIDEEVIWKVFLQTLLALAECHKHPEGVILHRDIKPGNIFLDKKQNVKLGDFGLARVLGENSLFAHTHVGTPFYMSPEQVNDSPYNEKSDIWSLGCLIYELASLHPPFEAKSQIALAQRIREGKFERIPARYSDDLQNAIAMTLQVDRTKRPNVDRLLELPQIAIRLRERKVNQHYAVLKAKQEELSQWERELVERERATIEKENELAERERLLEERERRLHTRTTLSSSNVAPVYSTALRSIENIVRHNPTTSNAIRKPASSEYRLELPGKSGILASGPSGVRESPRESALDALRAVSRERALLRSGMTEREPTARPSPPTSTSAASDVRRAEPEPTRDERGEHQSPRESPSSSIANTAVATKPPAGSSPTGLGTVESEK